MDEACQSLGITICEPQVICVPDHKARLKRGIGFVECINREINRKTQFVLILLDRSDKYDKVKGELDSMGITSQVILTGTARKQRMRAICTNLLKQMNTKVPQDLYRIQLPSKMKGTM
jgi:hypothetical protein